MPPVGYRNINGKIYEYTDAEIEYLKKLIRNNAHLIIEFSQEGGITNASNF